MTYLYHEKQDSALCAVHSLNNLLQGHYYSAVELMNIAQELDAKEQVLMQELGNDTQDFRKYMSEESGNVAVDGNFSVEVIKKALIVFNLVSTPLNHPEMKEASEQPQRENGFICNLSNHWFAIRNVSGKFWDLNSLHKQPVYLSEIYLGAFLGQLQHEGYTIYVVRGTYPEIYRDYDSKDWVLAPTSNNRQNTNNNRNEEDDMAKAIAASLGTKNNSNSVKQPESPWGSNLHSLKSLNDSVGSGLDDDDDLARAIALSKTTAEAERETKRRKPNPSDVPSEPLTTESDLANIMIRLPTGKKVGRRFRQSDLLEAVFNWIFVTNEVDLFDNSKYHLVSSVDRKPLTQKQATLGDLSCKGNVLLILELI
jgi:ataxin-3